MAMSMQVTIILLLTMVVLLQSSLSARWFLERAGRDLLLWHSCLKTALPATFSDGPIAKRVPIEGIVFPAV